MRIPHTIDRNTVLVYEPSEESRSNSIEIKRTLRAEDTTWDSGLVPSLANLCTKVLPAILTAAVPCPAREHMLETLPTNLPLALADKYIEDGEYWKRRTADYWEGPNDASECNDSWKRYFLEKHMQELLEGLSPEGYVEEELENICELVSNFIFTLKIRELQVESRVLNEYEERAIQNEPRGRINLAPLIVGLRNLSELHIQFSIRNVGTNYNKVFFQFTAQDCRNLGEGIAASSTLKLLRIHHSSLDDSKLLTLLSQMQANRSLQALEFPHCNIGDEGAASLAKFIAERPQLLKLDLSNNRVGKSGTQALSFVLTQQNGSGLIQLNLRFNNFGDDGAKFLLSALHRKAPLLRNLNISCTGLKEDSGILLGEVLTRNECLVNLDVSNNLFGISAGDVILRGLSSNHSLQLLDLRMTGISGETLLDIENILHSNRLKKSS